jgi:hypothetical protein
MPTVRVGHEAVLKRPPAELFRIVLDPLRQVDWDVGTCLGVEPLTAGAAGKGATYRVHLKGARAPIELEIVGVSRDTRIVHMARDPSGILRHEFTFVAVPEGTRLVQTGELVPNGTARWLPIVAQRRLRARFAEIAEHLRRYLYAGGGRDA